MHPARLRLDICSSTLGAALCLGTLGCPKPAGHGSGVGRADCDTIDYEARGLKARVNVPQRVGFEVETNKQAIREVDQWVEKYFAAWSTACTDYKNGALTREEYRDETQRIRQTMERFEELALRLEKADSDQAFDVALRETWTTVVPAEQRTDLQMDLKVMAKTPGSANFVVAPPGASLPSKTEIYTVVQLTTSANVQMYQVANGQQVGLFPHGQNPQQNPLPAGVEVRVPATGVFELDDKDLGMEDLHIVATTDALSPIATNAGPPTAASAGSPDRGRAMDVGMGECKTRGLSFKPDKCPRTRGLVTHSTKTRGASIQAANAAGDRGVHVVYSFHHVGDAKVYGKKCVPGPDHKCRGVEQMRGIISHRPPAMPENFDACPDQAEAREMKGSGGSYERFCVEEDGSGQVVNHGPYRKWHGNGKLWVRGQMDMGNRTGEWATYDGSGNELVKISY